MELVLHSYYSKISVLLRIKKFQIRLLSLTVTNSVFKLLKIKHVLHFGTKF
jgi:hypothetical protein